MSDRNGDSKKVAEKRTSDDAINTRQDDQDTRRSPPCPEKRSRTITSPSSTDAPLPSIFHLDNRLRSLIVEFTGPLSWKLLRQTCTQFRSWPRALPPKMMDYQVVLFAVTRSFMSYGEETAARYGVAKTLNDAIDAVSYLVRTVFSSGSFQLSFRFINVHDGSRAEGAPVLLSFFASIYYRFTMASHIPYHIYDEEEASFPDFERIAEKDAINLPRLLRTMGCPQLNILHYVPSYQFEYGDTAGINFGYYLDVLSTYFDGVQPTDCPAWDCFRTRKVRNGNGSSRHEVWYYPSLTSSDSNLKGFEFQEENWAVFQEKTFSRYH